MSFVHLHVHTQYSILDGLSSIGRLFDRAEELGMPGLAITDHGNMYGIKEFFKVAKKHPGIKPIIGCEVYVTRHYDHNIKDSEHNSYYHLILLCKNYEGYKNLTKIVSTGHIEGMYYSKPRVSHEIIEKYHDNLICCSACLAGEVPKGILAEDLNAAREAIRWHKRVFGEDYYLEVQLHKSEVPGISTEVFDKQSIVSQEIFRLAEEEGVKVVATNDVHFVDKEDGPAHDRLICLTTNTMLDNPKRLRYTQQEYLKSEEEMAELFPEHPEAISNTIEICDKIEKYSIDRGHVLPKFEIEPDFLSHIDEHLEKYSEIIDAGRCDKDGKYRGDEFCYSVAYLCHITYSGAEKRYGETLNEEQKERLDFELKTICRMGFPDYFLIVQDYIAASRREGFFVGPGRGSAAGSAVAYCLGITNLDPIKYNLLFERFLNPDRISMPDIDVDFEDLVAAHRYVEDKYSKDHVSRVITFGTMLAKGAIKDVARISGLSIEESNRLSKMVPDKLNEKIEKEYPYNPKLDELKPGFKAIEKEIETDETDSEGRKIIVKKWVQKGFEETDVKVNLKNCFRLNPELKNEYENGSEINREVLKYAQKLEGCIRQVGVHACATIIGRGNLTDYIPISIAKDKETGETVWISQYDGHYIEDVGMLKMDFLGLNTLSIQKECLRNIQKRFGGDLIDIEAIPIDDPETYQLYSRGDTDSVFQFESPGMKKWLQKLNPNRFEDLIAMNALYRPGPMDYIPSFVARKQGQEPIEYDLPDMEEYLAETYGVTVYQEQVMLLSRKLANFTKGEADKLRKAMGKKQIDVMQELKEKFMTQGMANGHPEKTLDKIWKDWEKFAQYAFNKSHATCYAWISYQTGWLKTHYTAEFLAANLSCNLDKMDEIKNIMEDCKLHKIKVLCPDVNESENKFTVNSEGNIRFGLGGIKGFGSNIVSAIIQEREENGLFTDLFDFVERMSGTVNRKALEALAYSNAFESFGIKRSQFFEAGKSGDMFIDELSRYADSYRKDKENNAASLFGDMEEFMIVRPSFPPEPIEEDRLLFLQKEKEYVGMFLSAHPLDPHAFTMRTFCSHTLPEIDPLILECSNEKKKLNISFGGMVTEVKTGTTSKGSPKLIINLEDFDGKYEIALFGKDVDIFLPQFFEHAKVYVEGEIKEKYKLGPEEQKEGKTAPYSLRIKKVSQLGNVNEEHLRGICLKFKTDVLNSKFRHSLADLLKKHKGPTTVTIRLFDKESGYNIEFFSKKYSVEVSNDLIGGLNDLNISYSIEKKN